MDVICGFDTILIINVEGERLGRQTQVINRKKLLVVIVDIVWIELQSFCSYWVQNSINFLNVRIKYHSGN